jgi:hypothetical protein
MYNKRVWLNKEGSPSTGNVVCFDGNTTWHGEKMRNTFLQISDCNWSIRLHKIEDDSIDDFIDKIKLLRDEIDKFAMYLEQNK